MASNQCRKKQKQEEKLSLTDVFYFPGGLFKETLIKSKKTPSETQEPTPVKEKQT